MRESDKATTEVGDEITGARRCASHPNVETYLRCSKCGKPICPKCAVMTPVGSRCRQCAGLRRLPTYHLEARHYAIAVFVGLLVALVGGVVVAYIRLVLPFGRVLLPLAIGFIAGESISVAVNRKRGTPLRVVAGFSVILALLVQAVVPTVLALPSVLLSPVAIGSLVLAAALGLLVQPLVLIIALVAVVLAASRV